MADHATEPAAAITATCQPATSFSALPDELLLHIFSFLDVPDLLAVSRTSHHLRSLSLDRHLHSSRLRLSSHRLSHSLSLPQRPSLSSLTPPSSRIVLSSTHVRARSLSRQLIAIRLNRNLSRRPAVSDLVAKNVLPLECCGRSADGTKVWLAGAGVVSPGLVGVKRAVEREKVKDGLRISLERKRAAVEREDRRARDEKRDVRGLVRRFTVMAGWREPSSSGSSSGSGNPAAGKVRGKRWGPDAVRCKDEPARAHVLGLRRFWEGLANGPHSLKA